MSLLLLFGSGAPVVTATATGAWGTLTGTAEAFVQVLVFGAVIRARETVYASASEPGPVVGRERGHVAATEPRPIHAREPVTVGG